MKIGRNEPCWCKSGKKYKKCHEDRDKQKRITVQDVIDETKKATERVCLHPEANENVCNEIIRAHSIQRAAILQKISRNQHVYSFGAKIGAMIKTGRIEPKLIGINKASTFTGFCNYHDTEVFKPIEASSIDIYNEHIFLTAYRSLCKELFAKKYQSNMIPLTKQGDKGIRVEDQIAFQSFIENYKSGVEAGLNDLLESKKIYDSYLLSKNYGDVIYYVIETGEISDIVVSGRIHVEMDFNGNELQTSEERLDYSKTLDEISFSMLMRNSNGLIIFSCLKNEKKSIEFLKSIDTINDADLPNSIVRFSFEYFENAFMSPNWWEGLSAKNKEAIIERMNDSIVFTKRSNNALKDDGNNYVSWKILNRHKNF